MHLYNRVFLSLNQKQGDLLELHLLLPLSFYPRRKVSFQILHLAAISPQFRPLQTKILYFLAIGILVLGRGPKKAGLQEVLERESCDDLWNFVLDFTGEKDLFRRVRHLQQIKRRDHIPERRAFLRAWQSNLKVKKGFSVTQVFWQSVLYRSMNFQKSLRSASDFFMAFKQSYQAILDFSAIFLQLGSMSSTRIQKISSISLKSMRRRSSSETPLATKKVVLFPWDSKESQMLGSMRLWIYIPVSSCTSRAAHSLAVSCWFHLPLGNPNLFRVLTTSTFESSLLKIKAPQTGLFSWSFMRIFLGSMRREGGACWASLARNQFLSCSQWSGAELLRMTSMQQQKAFSDWQASRLESSCSWGGRLMMNLASICSKRHCSCLWAMDVIGN